LYKGDYKSDRNSDRQRQGQSVNGLRYARNAIVHGDVVVDVAESADIPNPSTLVVHNRLGARTLGPPTRVEWTFRQTLPPPDKPAPKLGGWGLGLPRCAEWEIISDGKIIAGAADKTRTHGS
jgi:hypothetical protein